VYRLNCWYSTGNVFPKFRTSETWNLTGLSPETWPGRAAHCLFAQLLLLFPFNICQCVCVGAWQVLPNESRLAIYMCLCLTQPGSASSTHRRPLSFIARKARINSKTATEQKKKLKIALSPSLLVGIFLFCRWKPNSRLCAYLCKQVRVIYAYRTVLPQPFNHSTAQPVIEITPRQNAWLPKLQLHVLVDSAEWLFSSVWICVLLRHKHYTNICKFWGSAGIELNASLLEQEFSSGIRKGNIPIKTLENVGAKNGKSNEQGIF